MKKILYFGHLNNRSYGDEIGIHLFKEFVKKHKYNFSIDEFNIKAGESLPKTKHDFYLLGCGTCLSNLYRYYADQLLGPLKGKNYGVLGAGVYFENSRSQKKTNFIKSSSSIQKTTSIISNASFISVRDDASKKYLDSLNTQTFIGVLYDPGMSVQWKKLSIKRKKPILGYNICGTSPNCLGTMTMTEEKIEKILSFIKSKKDKYDLMYIPFNKKDLKLAQNRKLETIGTVVGWGPPPKIAGHVQNADIFLGVRVHSDITAAAYGIPFLSIAYTYPNINFLDHIEYDYYINLEKSLNNLETMFEKVEKNKKEIKTNLLKKAEIARKTYEQEAHRLCKIISSI